MLSPFDGRVRSRTVLGYSGNVVSTDDYTYTYTLRDGYRLRYLDPENGSTQTGTYNYLTLQMAIRLTNLVAQTTRHN